jgi:hypothetical protein
VDTLQVKEYGTSKMAEGGSVWKRHWRHRRWLGWEVLRSGSHRPIGWPAAMIGYSHGRRTPYDV